MEHYHIVARIGDKKYDKMFLKERQADNFARKLMKEKPKAMRLEYKEAGYAEDVDDFVSLEVCDNPDCEDEGLTREEQEYEMGHSDADAGL